MMESKTDFWNSRYLNKNEDELGWYEKESEPSLSLINECGINKDALILDVGSGASTLIDNLLGAGYVNIVATDISDAALNKTKHRISDTNNRVQFIVDDITKSALATQFNQVDLWHDRATFHFFNKNEDQQAYLEVLNTLMKPGGFVLISTFALNGAKQCSGLPIQQYSSDQLSAFLGGNYQLITSLSYQYQTPWNEGRPFMYAVFKKKE